MRPRLLDLFCCAGGAAMGYHKAGFDVVGIDIKPQPNYPFKFIRKDVLTVDAGWIAASFDAVHASPPCQGYTWSAKRWKGVERSYLVDPVRDMLNECQLPWIMENVPGAPLRDPVRLCGEMFGLNVIRHRNFEASFPLVAPDHVPHRRPIQRKAKDGTDRLVQRSVYCCVAGHGGEGDSFRLEDWQAAMGIDWMAKHELVEAIPPAYTKYLGEQLMAEVIADRAHPASFHSQKRAFK